MIKALIDAVQLRLPLTILKAEWNDPVLSLRGPNWRFNTTSSWRLVDVDRLVLGSEDSGAQSAILELAGLDIVGCKPMSALPELDPKFVLENGLSLEVFSATSIEPWVFSLDDGPIFVASPSS